MKIHDALAELAVPLDELVPFPGNPRRGDVDAIAKSLERNAQYKPIIVSKATGHILAGNHTFLAAQQLGWEHIAAVLIDVDEATARRIVAADNRTAELGGYDTHELADLLRAIEADDEAGLEGTGFDAGYLDHLDQLNTPRDLDELAEDVGEYDEAEMWPELRIKLPPPALEAFRDLTDGHGDDETGRMLYLLRQAGWEGL